ncbi:MAG: N-formylglutamate amidohydrolase [Acidimicrobiia bacterium]
MATAIHAGHSLRPEIAARIALDEEVRRREEDPHTDLLTHIVPLRVTVDRSRFEVDLNRSRDQAVYMIPDQAWGLQVWRTELDSDTIEKSLAIYDWFYDELGRRLDVLATRAPFVVLDIHSYNHRRDGAGLPAGLQGANPDVNIGTGSLDRPVWAALIDQFAVDLGKGLGAEATIRENVRFKGGYFSQWIHERYPGRGCALALEFKKTFMDEWTGHVDLTRLNRLREALAGAIPGLVSRLKELR